ncbi:MAG: YwqG family protein [Bacteroides sp.]|nr:YwqG family protein [Bacteroides sp.]
MDLKNKLKKTLRNSIRLCIEGEAESRTGATRFGGRPDAPRGFEWAYREEKDINGEAVRRPLSFIAQFDLSELGGYDTEKLLPERGLLSFFYDTDTLPRGYDPKRRDCARTFYFENTEELVPADFPDDLEEKFRFPAVGIKARREDSYQDYPDFLLQREKLTECWDDYDRAARGLKINVPDNSSKLLGWADVLRDNMTNVCELVSRGYCLTDGTDEVSPRDRQETEQSSADEWRLLLQLDTVKKDDLELTFGGRLYYYIRKEDLAERNFDNVMLIRQSR